MKKTLFSLLVVLAAIFSANAQFYAGGSLGITSNSDANPKSALEFSPEVGFYITKKFDVGLGLGFKTQTSQNNNEYTSWSFAPYARYSFYQFGKFETLVKGSFALGGNDNAGAKSAFAEFSVSPILAYNLTEEIVLFTNLNCFSLSLSTYAPEVGNSSSRFNFRTTTNGLLNTSNLPVGLIYKF